MLATAFDQKPCELSCANINFLWAGWEPRIIDDSDNEARLRTARKYELCRLNGNTVSGVALRIYERLFSANLFRGLDFASHVDSSPIC